MGQAFLQSFVWLLLSLSLLRRIAYTYHNTNPRTRERRLLLAVVALLYDSPVRQYSRVNRAPTFMDTENSNFPQLRGYA